MVLAMWCSSLSGRWVGCLPGKRKRKEKEETRAWETVGER